MGDWIYDHFMWIIGGVFILISVVLIHSANVCNEKHNVLFQQCMDDGKKEYECAALLNNNNGINAVIPMTMVISR